jgi:hypothetical protein
MAVERKPSVTAAPLLKNSPQAPFIYFDSAPVRGSFNGTIEVELSTRTLLPKPDGSVAAEAVCVAHLRCTPASAQGLIDALKQALEFHAKQVQEFVAQEHEPPRETLNS